MKNKDASRGPERVGTEFSYRSQEALDWDAGLKEAHLALLDQFGIRWNRESLLTARRGTISRILFLDRLYRRLLPVPGVICEFGVQWGATLSTLINLRAIYEPYNHARVIFGFDTFQGFMTLDAKDGHLAKPGDYAVPGTYKKTLEDILALQEAAASGSEKVRRQFRLYDGDASESIATWIADNPHAIVGLAMFDMDVYRPTKDVLQRILPRLTKGSILYFDELSCPEFPGETIALMETLGLSRLRLRQDPHQPYAAWAVYEG